jgi:hypothetical protein
VSEPDDEIDESGEKASRRQVVRAVGVALGAAVLSAAPRRVAAGDVARDLLPKPNPPSPTAVPHANGEVAALFGDLVAGVAIAGCTIVSVHAPVAGAIPVVLVTSSGKRFQLDVLRREIDPDAPRAVAGLAGNTSFEVSVCNGGNGDHATDEEQGLAARALAEALSKRVAQGAKAPALLTLREREARGSGGVLRLRV